jgi:hypothetical protein
MEITNAQLRIFKMFSGIPTKIMRKYFEIDNYYKRREMAFTMTQQGHIKSLKMFNFFINNASVENAEDILLPNDVYFLDAFPKRFKNN